MNVLALNILANAATRARYAPIERTFAHRLALAWLVHNRISTPWQAHDFWERIGSDPKGAGPHTDYCRTRDFRITFRGWHRNASLPDNATLFFEPEQPGIDV